MWFTVSSGDLTEWSFLASSGCGKARNLWESGQHCVCWCAALSDLKETFVADHRQDMSSTYDIEKMCWQFHSLEAGRNGLLKLEYLGKVLRFWKGRCNERHCTVRHLVCFDALHRWWRHRFLASIQTGAFLVLLFLVSGFVAIVVCRY